MEPPWRWIARMVVVGLVPGGTADGCANRMLPASPFSHCAGLGNVTIHVLRGGESPRQRGPQTWDLATC